MTYFKGIGLQRNAPTGSTISNYEHIIELQKEVAALKKRCCCASGSSGGMFNVMNYGAFGDGVNEDSVAIQSAIDAAELAGGGIVYFPAGTYKVTAGTDREGLLVGDNTTLLGEGDISVILFIPDVASSTAIVNKSSSGQLTVAEQRVGNVNISIQSLKVLDTRTTEFVDIGISLNGVDGFLLENLTVENVGGYAYLIGRTNDDADIGTESKNGVGYNLRGINVMDQGLEIWGATNVRFHDIYISGPGTTIGFGQGLLVWHGAQGVTVTNLTVVKEDVVGRNIAAFAVCGWGTTPGTVTGERKTKNIIIENVNASTDVAMRINSIYNVADAILQVEDVTIRNSYFNGFDAATLSSDIRHVKGLTIEGCKFTNFIGHLQITPPSLTTLQNTVLNLDIFNCVFEGGESIEAFGLSNFRFIGNNFLSFGNFPPLIIQGGRYGVISSNYFYNIGTSSATTCIVLKLLDESSTVETERVEVSYNTAVDDRGTKYTDYLVTLQDATDHIDIISNNVSAAKSSAQQYINTGTGINIRPDSGIYTPNTSVEVNLDAGLSLSDLKFSRSGRNIRVWGRFTADPTAAVLTGFQISLVPGYNSQLTTTDELVGFAVSGGVVNMAAEILANAGNNTAQVRWIATDLTAQEWGFEFSYIVNPF